jgi:hypothetical protein
MRRQNDMLNRIVRTLLAPLLLSPVLALAHGDEPHHGEATSVTAAHEHAEQEEAADPLQFGPLKVGLDAMVRGESTNNFTFTDFTFAPDDNDQRLLLRLRPALTYTPNEHLNARVEGQWYAFYNDGDFDRASLYQGYVEGKLPNEMLALRAGRQELVYGSVFMLGSDSFFDGLTYDAVKLTVKPADPLSVDLFGGKYARQQSDGIEGELYGIYGTYAAGGEKLGLDLYGLLDTGEDGSIPNADDHERTWSMGARLTGKLNEHVALEVEPVYQLGRKNLDGFSHDEIRAFGGHADLTVDLHKCKEVLWHMCRLVNPDLQPPAPGRYPGQAFLSYAFGSGDDDADDGRFREFRNPNNDTALIGDMSVIGDLSGVTAISPAGDEVSASGLHVVTAGFGVDVTEKLNVSLDGHYFRADETPENISKEIGLESNLILTYALSDQVALLLGVNRFFTGSFFRDATGSGKDIDYGYLQLQATF